VKVTVVPVQTGLAEAAMDIPAGTFAWGIMMIGLDVTGPLEQVRLDVRVQVTKSPPEGE